MTISSPITGIQKYHITIKNLASGEKRGFMLDTTKGEMFSMTTLPLTIGKNQYGDITMGDLTNTSVFVQYNRSGVTTGSGELVGPSETKYWVPQYLYSNLLPTSAYWYAYNVDTNKEKGEIKLSQGTQIVTTGIPATKISCSVADGDVYYAGSATVPVIYKYQNNTWSTFLDLTGYGNKIANLKIIRSKNVKKLVIITDSGTNNLFTYALSEYVGYDLLKSISTIFTKYQDATTKNLDPQNFTYGYPTATFAPVTPATITYSSISATVDQLVSLKYLADGLWLATLANTDYLREFIGIRRCRVINGSYIQRPLIELVNINGTPVSYRYNEVSYSIPGNTIVLNLGSTFNPNVMSGTTYNIQGRKIQLYNKINTANTSSCRIGFAISSGAYYTIGIGSSFILIDSDASTGLTISGGSFSFDASSYQKVFDFTATNVEDKLAPTGAIYDVGGQKAVIKGYYGATTNQPTVEYLQERMLLIPPKDCGQPYYGYQTLVASTRVVYLHTAISTSGAGTLDQLQRIDNRSSTDKIIHCLKGPYSQSENTDEQFSYVLTENTDNEVKLYKINLFTTTDYRAWYGNDLGTSFFRNSNYYSKPGYRIDGKYPNQKFENTLTISTMGFDSEVFDTRAEELDQSFVVLKDEEDTSNRCIIYKTNEEGLQKETEIIGEQYLYSIAYNNSSLYFIGTTNGYVYRYTVTPGNYNNNQITYHKLFNGANNKSVGVLYDGKYLVQCQITGIVYGYDLLSGRFLEYTTTPAVLISSILSIGNQLFFQGPTSVYKSSPTILASSGYLVSSIYGGFIGTVNKNRVQGRVLINKQSSNVGQSLRLAVSFDEGATFHYLPRVIGFPLIPDNFTGAVATQYEYTYSTFEGANKNELTFRFPYDSLSKKLCYKVEFYRGTGTLDTIKVSHVELHFLLNSLKEFYLNLNLRLIPKQRLLDNSIEHAPDAHREKLAFLQDIRENGTKIELTLPRGDKYYAVPFSLPGQGTDGLSVIGTELNAGKNDMDMFGFLITIALKTIKKI